MCRLFGIFSSCMQKWICYEHKQFWEGHLKIIRTFLEVVKRGNFWPANHKYDTKYFEQEVPTLKAFTDRCSRGDLLCLLVILLLFNFVMPIVNQCRNISIAFSIAFYYSRLTRWHLIPKILESALLLINKNQIRNEEINHE